MSLCSQPVSFITFEKKVEYEDQIPAQFCWQPAECPGVSPYTGPIYEEGRQKWLERRGFGSQQ